MNMIRHWGGGYYETDEFYQICDELGIMVWQDFMFGNDWQPGTYAFKLNIEAEAEDQVRRLRNHPSIVVWCGNNETEAALNWGDRAKLPADVKFQMWQDYLTEFSGILNRVVARLAPETPYWPSSPSADYEADHGWISQWRRAPVGCVAWARAVLYVRDTPLSLRHGIWLSIVPGGADYRSVHAAGGPHGYLYAVMLAHQKNNEGNSIIHDYLLKDYPEPKDFPSFLYVSQVLQQRASRLERSTSGVRARRRWAPSSGN